MFFGRTVYKISKFHRIRTNAFPTFDNSDDITVHTAMQDTLAIFRDEHQPIYSDPESLQVAQVMNKLDSVRVWNELDEHYRSQTLGDDPNEPVRDRGERYESVRRGMAWQSECAIFGLDTTAMDANTVNAVKVNLAAVATHSVLYGAVELDNEAESRHNIFGPDGVLWPVMEVFASDSDQKRRLYGIQSLLVVVMRQAMNIAEIFDRSSTLGGDEFNNTDEY